MWRPLACRVSGLRTNFTKFSKPARLYAPVPRRGFCQPLSVEAPKRNFGRMLGYTFGGLGLLGFSAYQGLNAYQSYHTAPVEFIDPPIEPPTAEYRHPYHDKPWYEQFYMKMKRLIYFTVLFTPVTIGAIMASIFGDEWRQWMLDKLVKTLEQSGCSFQKFAQWLSMRPDIVPADVCEALGTMHNATPAHAMEHTRKEIQTCFGKPLEELFTEFDETPVASGSVAQVHRARLRENGKEVAVKVRHPNVILEVYADLDIIFKMVDLASKYTRLAIPFDHNAWKMLIRQQMDFNWEAYNMYRFQQYFKGDDIVEFPEIKWDLLSESVLVEDWTAGKTVSSILSMFGEKYDEVKGDFSKEVKERAAAIEEKFSSEMRRKKQILAKKVFDVNMKMFLRDNYVHGDLHGGNVMYSEDSDKLTVIDTGLVTSIGADYADEFGMFLHSICTGNTSGVADNVMKFAVSEPPDMDAFRSDLTKEVLRFCGEEGSTKAPDGSPLDLGEMIGGILNTLQNHNVALRGDVAINIVTMSVSEGLIRRLDPEFDCVTRSLPYFVKYRAWNTEDLHTTVDTDRQAMMLYPGQQSFDSEESIKKQRERSEHRKKAAMKNQLVYQ